MPRHRKDNPLKSGKLVSMETDEKDNNDLWTKDDDNRGAGYELDMDRDGPYYPQEEDEEE